jgi:hypothetical protein
MLTLPRADDAEIGFVFEAFHRDEHLDQLGTENGGEGLILRHTIQSLR